MTYCCSYCNILCLLFHNKPTIYHTLLTRVSCYSYYDIVTFSAYCGYCAILSRLCLLCCIYIKCVDLLSNEWLIVLKATCHCHAVYRLDNFFFLTLHVCLVISGGLLAICVGAILVAIGLILVAQIVGKCVVF